MVFYFKMFYIDTTLLQVNNPIQMTRNSSKEVYFNAIDSNLNHRVPK